jgi:hypothetical protein
MAIEFLCEHCGQKLRVPDEHAGKIARCPQCQTELPVPARSPAQSPAANPFASSLPSQGASFGRDPSWYVKTPDGERHGPLTKAELEGWRSSGRLNHNCELLQNGWEQWKWADEVFPELAPRAGEMQQPRPQPRPLTSDNPYAANTAGYEPSPTGYPGQHYVKPHRGGLILGLGIGSFFLCALCGIFSLGMSIPAWVMAQADLKEMEAGLMDSSGEGTTRAGWILSMIHVILLVVGIVVYIAFIVAVVAIDPN